MKVLLIGHNVLSENNNMGKTMLSYFADFSRDEMAEFYIQDKYPDNTTICNNYFRFTDRDALKSVFGIMTKHIFNTTTIEQKTGDNKTIETIRQYGRKRNVFVYFMRNLIWRIARWRTKELKDWLNEFNPDVIFFMSGDYKFMYDITLYIKNYLQKPLIVSCVDDYYLYNRNSGSRFGKYQHKKYMNTVYSVMEQASCILAISESMTAAYQKLFNKPCYTLHTSAIKRDEVPLVDEGNIAYFGNLGFNRREPLIDLGKALTRIGISEHEKINVYSGEKNPAFLEGLTTDNGIVFHGEIPYDLVMAKMSDCVLILHVESFDKKIDELIKYSVSTKIADSLLNGPCIFAYGPEELASIEYLKKNKAAYVITKKEELEDGLKEILTNKTLRSEIVRNARELAYKNHDEAKNIKKVRALLQMTIDGC